MLPSLNIRTSGQAVVLCELTCRRTSALSHSRTVTEFRDTSTYIVKAKVVIKCNAERRPCDFRALDFSDQRGWVGTMDSSWWLVNLSHGPPNQGQLASGRLSRLLPRKQDKTVTCWLSTFHLQPAVQKPAPVLCSLSTCPEARHTTRRVTWCSVISAPSHSPTSHGRDTTCQPSAPGDVWMDPTGEQREAVRKQHMAGSDEFPHCFKGLPEACREIETSRSSLLD